MSSEEIKNQINIYKGKITNLEVEFSKKEIYAKKEIDEKYSSKFEVALSKFKNKIQNVEKIDFNAKEFVKIRKKEKEALKFIKKEITSLSKKKEKELREQLKLINHEKTHIFENLRMKIKALHKKLKLLEAKKFANKWKKWGNL